MLIGLDFDNTLASYDEVFLYLAKKKALLAMIGMEINCNLGII